MDVFAAVLILLGFLVAFAGGIMFLAAAFRESLWWGLGSLFLGPVALVFLILHWAEARRGFWTQLIGLIVVAGGIVASATVRQQISEGIAKSMPAGMNLPLIDKPKPPEDINLKIELQRTKVDQWEAQFAQQGGVVSQQFQGLNARRAALKADDAAAVAAFNAAVADYQQANAAQKQLRQQIDTGQQELTEMLNERSRKQAGGNPGGNNVRTIGSAPAPAARSAGNHGPVIIYSTSHCPWCVKAKEYFAAKGVRYEERDIERSPAANEEFQRLGGRGVPLIMVGSEKMEGFNPQRLDQIL